MRVDILYQSDVNRPLKDPLPDEVTGTIFIKRIYSGDLLRPAFGNWFKVPFPKIVGYKKSVKESFYAWQIDLIWFYWRGYIGAKVFGVDSPEYKNWLPEECVYEGSNAMAWSIRPFSFKRKIK